MNFEWLESMDGNKNKGDVIFIVKNQSWKIKFTAQSVADHF